ncbi:hypothetical protein TNCV_1261631 [Trichonephila clavipes]|nr:hypothetical protein TNCV_1261631 [Trichonephila clavipes]
MTENYDECAPQYGNNNGLRTRLRRTMDCVPSNVRFHIAVTFLQSWERYKGKNLKKESLPDPSSTPPWSNGEKISPLRDGGGVAGFGGAALF